MGCLMVSRITLRRILLPASLLISLALFGQNQAYPGMTQSAGYNRGCPCYCPSAGDKWRSGWGRSCWRRLAQHSCCDLHRATHDHGNLARRSCGDQPECCAECGNRDHGGPWHALQLPGGNEQRVREFRATVSCEFASDRRFGALIFAGAGPVNGAEATAAASLGEVASKYKAGRPSQNVRTYTNADVQRMDQTMNLRGENINARLASEPSQNSPAANMQPQIAGLSGTMPNPGQASRPQLYASARPSPAIREDQNQNSANSNAQAQSSGPTTPQVSQPKPDSQSADRQSNKELPATATLLPLLGILGLASGGIGLVFRKYRK